MESLSSLILTKLRPPALHSRAISRTRLLEQLSLEANTDLVLVCAPAGYGKTSLLVEWIQSLRQTDTAIAWYSLDENDNKPETFGAYMIASLGQAIGQGSTLDHIGQVMRTTPEVNLQLLLPTVINALCSVERKIVLILDDYHLIRDTAIHQAVDFLLSYRPENFHLAIGSRINPPLPLARLRAKRRLIELRAPDLRFTTQETHRFLHDSMQLAPTEEQSKRLAFEVEGWAAGMQLAALTLSGREINDDRLVPIIGGHRRLVEYLMDEVVNQLPEDLQAFLLYSSVLERMSAPVCDQVLGLKNSASLLSRIEALNLFITVLDDQTSLNSWYRYHHLFQDFLRTWLSKSQPDQHALIHSKAADWFATHGYLREAGYHAFQSGDWFYAADFVEKYSFSLIIQSDIVLINDWCSTFPQVIFRERPLLCVFQGLALAYRFQAKNQARVEECLLKAHQALESVDDPIRSLAVEELTAVVQTFLAMIPRPNPNIDSLIAFADRGLTTYPPGNAGRFTWLLVKGYIQLALNQYDSARASFDEALPLAVGSGFYFGYVETTFHLARMTHSLGRLHETLEIVRKTYLNFDEINRRFEASQSGEPPAKFPAIGCLDVIAGCVLLDQLNIEEAERLLRQGLERMGWGMSPYYLMTAYLALFQLYEIRGTLPEAFACLDQLDALWPDIHFITNGFRAQARLKLQPASHEAIEYARGWIETYQRLVGDSMPLAGSGPIGTAESFYQASLIWARLQILLDQPQEVQSFLEQQLEHASDKGLASREIEIQLVQAQMYHQSGQVEAALHRLEQALIISRQNGYKRAFIQNAVLDDLIHQAILRGMFLKDLEPIFSVIRGFRIQLSESSPNLKNLGTSRFPSRAESLVEALSKRELDILCMIASGASNQAIAGQFVITIGTVKSHIHHIFQKMGVRNRTEAVSLARKMGMID